MQDIWAPAGNEYKKTHRYENRNDEGPEGGEGAGAKRENEAAALVDWQYLIPQGIYIG